MCAWLANYILCGNYINYTSHLLFISSADQPSHDRNMNFIQTEASVFQNSDISIPNKLNTARCVFSLPIL